MLAKDGVTKGSPFFIFISKTPPKTLEEFLKKAEKYINYKNVLEVENLKSSEKQNTQKTTTQIKSDKPPKSDERKT